MRRPRHGHHHRGAFQGVRARQDGRATLASIQGQKLLDILCTCKCDGRAGVFTRPIGVHGEKHHDIAVHAFRKECRGLCIKRCNEMPLGEILWRVADSDSDFNIVGTKWVAAKCGVEAVPTAFEEE